MAFEGQVWRVSSGERQVGEILIDDADFPWLSGSFVPGPAYDTVEALFAREIALLEGDFEQVEEWEAAYYEIRRHVSLSSPDGPVPEFLLHIEGDRAWLRWSDEPFEGGAGGLR
ncbi:hypothetical protein [Streptomyces griseus]|uniref:hypothetical protein n=1 Tax=Streptomyces griseus TaxID=1911 RepID=UPI00056020EB|nr:hypothetical protein [Streptomyces griseus]